MKRRTYLPLVVSLVFAALSTGQAGITIQVTGLFRYPAAREFLTTGQINDENLLVGYVNAGEQGGFYAKPGVRFSAPFKDPDATGDQTLACGINNQRHICGSYHDAAIFGFKGFIRIGQRYTTFVAPVEGVGNTLIYSINDADSFVGVYDLSSYSMIGGVFHALPIPASASAATGINNLDQIVGEYATESGSTNFQGYFLDTDGSLTTYAFPGAERTEPNAINDAGLIVGTWTDGNYATHGFLLQLPFTFISYDVPGASNTTITGINNNGTICGTCTIPGNLRGFTARVIETNQ